MATYDNAYLSVNGVDLSSYLQTIEIEHTIETNDDTTMGNSYRSADAGLKTRVITATLVQNYASGGPDDTLNALFGTTTTVVTAHDGSTASATNPTETQTMLCTEYREHSGTAGDLELCRVTFIQAGNVTRATS